MARDYHVERRSRLPLIQALDALGLPMETIGTMIGWDRQTAKKDLASIGIRRVKPKDPKEVFRVVLQRYASILTMDTEALTSLDGEVAKHLADWLKVDEIRAIVFGLEMAKSRLTVPSYAPETEACARLLHAIFGGHWYTRPNLMQMQQTFHMFWISYLTELARRDQEALPNAHPALLEDIADYHLREWREEIMPIWPNNVAESVERVLQTLEDRVQKILRMRFGIGDAALTLEQVAKHFEITKERVRQIEAKALRKLRHPSRAKYLVSLVRALRIHVDVPELELIQGIVVKKTLAPLPTDDSKPNTSPEKIKENLLKSVDELELSIRSANCLYNGPDGRRIRYVWEIVDLSETQLLKIKNFGRKSLKEIKEVLKEMGLDRLGREWDAEARNEFVTLTYEQDKVKPPDHHINLIASR